MGDRSLSVRAALGHFEFKVARSTVVVFYIRIEHVDKLIKCCAKINADLDGQEVSRIGC